MEKERWRLTVMVAILKLRDEYKCFANLPIMINANGIQWVGLIDARFLIGDNDNDMGQST